MYYKRDSLIPRHSNTPRGLGMRLERALMMYVGNETSGVYRMGTVVGKESISECGIDMGWSITSL